MRECLRNWSDAGHTDCGGGRVPFERHGYNWLRVRISAVGDGGQRCADDWLTHVVAGALVVGRVRSWRGEIRNLAGGNFKGRIRFDEMSERGMHLARVGHRSRPEGQPAEEQPYRAPPPPYLRGENCVTVSRVWHV